MDKNLVPTRRLQPLISTFVVLVLLVGVFSFFEIRIYYQRRENNFYLASNQIKLIESSLDTVMARAYTLRSLVKSNNGNTDFFDQAAPEIYEETAQNTGLYVKNLILAPNGVVEKVYPMEGNENLIGFDYMDSSLDGNAEAQEAYQENELVLTEPFNLQQGGVGIAGRLPVYLDGADGEEFWGMVSVTLDMDYLLKTFNLSYLESSGLNYCLWYTDTAGEKVVLASSEELPESPISCEMSAVNLDWTLDVAPSKGWFPPLEAGAGAAIILLFTVLAYWAFRSSARVRSMNAVLEEIAIRDNLTGCYSRHYVNVVLLESGTKNWKDPNANYSLAVVDVDCFKRINDTYGHDMGDQALVAIARVLQNHRDVLRGDCVVRYGGDEFIFLMNDIYRKRFEAKLDSILKQVRAIRIPTAPDMRLTVSIGAVMGNGTDDYYTLFSKADAQVYAAKEAGKDRYSLA